MKRSGKIAVLTAFAGLLVTLGAAFASSPGAGAEPLSPAQRQAQEPILRLTELPAGYVLGGRYFCGAPRRPGEEEGFVEAGGPWPPTPYETFLAHNATNECVYAYERLYRPTGAPAGPTAVISFTFVTPSVAAAAEVLADGRLGAELTAHTIGEETALEGLSQADSPPAVGEGALRFHSDRFYWDGRSDLAATVVLWRQGNLVAGILAGGADPGVDDAAADDYAALQQKLLEAPRPYAEAEAEDIPTFLGNPNLGVPVYWLGKEFRSGHGREPSDFVRADAGERLPHARTGRRMSIQYRDELFIDSWTPAGWRKFSRTEVGRSQSSPRCAHSRTVKLPEGHAVIYAAYRGGSKICADFAPHQLSATVFLPGAVVAIGESLCRNCQSEQAPEFDSATAIRAIIRGLHRWRPGSGA